MKGSASAILFTGTALISLIFLWSIYKILFQKSGRRRRNPPPSPRKMPIIGNLHQLSSLPHRDLHILAQKHGPLMLLHFGSVPVLIVSSADSAREILKTHDLVFSDRPRYKASMKLFYGGNDLAFSPYGEYWRQMKSIFMVQLLSNKRVQTYRSIMEEETVTLMREIAKCSGAAVNLSEMFVKGNINGVCRSAFGNKYSESEDGKRFLRLTSDLIELVGAINIADFLPWLGWINRVNGFDTRLDCAAKQMDQVLERVIQQRLEEMQQQDHVTDDGSGQSFLDVLLGFYSKIPSVDDAAATIDRDSMKSLILDVFLGGTETVSAAMEWAMSELLRHPMVMEKLQRELRGIIKHKQDDIKEEDLAKMNYLKAVIKETMRCHPPGPLLVPRLARADVQIKGFDISAGTVVMINAWSIGKDPVSWDEPEEFKPERFLNSSIDFKGFDFELVPFGAGRRGCPGLMYSVAAIELMLAYLVTKFDWKLPDGVEPKDLDMSESPGLAVHKTLPLLALASQAA